MTLKLNTEGTFKNTDGEIFNYRIYKDGGSKVESNNSLEFFETISELERYISSNKK